MIASSYTLAATVCSLLTSVIGLPLGRRGCILLGDVLVIIGGSLQASAWSVAQIIVGRVICVWLPILTVSENSLTTHTRGSASGYEGTAYTYPRLWCANIR